MSDKKPPKSTEKDPLLEGNKTVNENWPDVLPFFDGTDFVRPSSELEPDPSSVKTVPEDILPELRDRVANQLVSVAGVIKASDKLSHGNPPVAEALEQNLVALDQAIKTTRKALGLSMGPHEKPQIFEARVLGDKPPEIFYGVADADILEQWTYPTSPSKRHILKLEDRFHDWGFPDTRESGERLARDLQLEAFFLDQIQRFIEPSLVQLRSLSSVHRNQAGIWLEKAIDDENMASKMLSADGLMNDVARLLDQIKNLWNDHLADRNPEGRPTLTRENLAGAFRGIEDIKRRLQILLESFKKPEALQIIAGVSPKNPVSLTRENIIRPSRIIHNAIRRPNPSPAQLAGVYEVVKKAFGGMIMKPALMLPGELQESIDQLEDLEDRLNTLRMIFSRQSNITPQRQSEWDGILKTILEDHTRLEAVLTMERLGFLPAKFPPRLTFERFRGRHRDLSDDLAEASEELSNQARWKAFFKTADHREAERKVAEIEQQIEKAEGFLNRLLESRFQ